MKHVTTRQWAIYKGMGGNHGAVQFDLQLPHWYDDHGNRDYTGEKALVRSKDDELTRKVKDGWKSREGCVFMNITSTKDGAKNVYDWDNKIVIALSVQDIGTLLETLATGKEAKIVHDPNAKTSNQGSVKKFLAAKKSPQGVLFTVTMISGGDKKSHTVPLSVAESLVLKELLSRAVSQALNW